MTTETIINAHISTPMWEAAPSARKLATAHGGFDLENVMKLRDGPSPAGDAFRLYPIPQKAPHVSARMNPVPTPPSENDAFPTQHGWNGVNVPNLPEGQRPKATDVSPWYGVYFKN